MTLTKVFLPRRRMWAGILAGLLLAGCASVPPPTDLMARAQQQLDAARQAQAGDFAPVDLGFATQRFQAAQSAMAAKKYDVARDMANEALADGRLAQTRAELAVVRRQLRAQGAENSRLRAQLLSTPAAAASAPGDADNGLPRQIVLPQPPAPAPAASSAMPSAPPATHGPEAAP